MNDDIILAADNIGMSAGEESGIAESAVRGVGTAFTSGLLSIYNTIQDYTGGDPVDIEQTIRDYDADWGDFYARNKSAVDIGGFVATSIIPGGLGIQALKLARAGRPLGSLSRALGYASSRQDLALRRALRELGREGGTVTKAVSQRKREALLWGAADDVLMATTAELAILATMHQSPIFEGDDAWDFTKNVLLGSAVGGVFGSGVNFLVTRGIMKSATSEIGKLKRQYDALLDPAKMNMSAPDEVMVFADDLVNALTKPQMDVIFNYMTEQGRRNVRLPTSKALPATLDRAQAQAYDRMRMMFNRFAEDEDLGQEMFTFIAQKIAKAKADPTLRDAVKDEIGGYLMSLGRVARVTPDAVKHSREARPQVFYARRKMGKDEDWTKFLDTVKDPKTTFRTPLLIVGDLSQANIVYQSDFPGVNLRDLFRQGNDVVFDPKGGVHINPRSPLFAKGKDPAENNRWFLDLKNGTLSDDVVPTIGDFGVDVSDLARKLKPPVSRPTSISEDTVMGSARFVYLADLAKKKPNSFRGSIIDANDIPALEAALGLPAQVRSSLSFDMGDQVLMFSDLPSGLEFLIQDRKLSVLRSGLEQGPVDLRRAEINLNVSQEWLEEAISGGFKHTGKLNDTVKMGDMSHYFRPRTAELKYDFSQVQVAVERAGAGPAFAASTMLGHQYRKMLLERVSSSIADATLGPEFVKNLPDSANGLAKLTDEGGAGPTNIGASNADYGDRARLFVQQLGSQAQLMRQALDEQSIGGTLAPAINALRRDPEAVAEVGIAINWSRGQKEVPYIRVRTTTDESKTLDLIPADAVVTDKNGMVISVDETKVIRVKNKTAADALEDFYTHNDGVDEKKLALLAAQGIARNKRRISELIDRRQTPDLKSVTWKSAYSPPVDTSKYPHFAFIRTKEHAGIPSEVKMITARSQQQLRELASYVDAEQFEVLFKSDTESFFKAKGQYDYSQTLHTPRINAMMDRSGRLQDFMPETRPQNVLEDILNFTHRENETLINLALQTKYRSWFNEMEFLADQFDALNSSVFKGQLATQKSKVANPFRDYLKSALGISKQSEYPLISSLNETVDKIGMALGEKMNDVFRARSANEMVNWKRANEIAESYGLRSPYSSFESYMAANEKYPRNVIKDFFNTVNGMLSSIGLRWDMAHSVVNVISMPILMGTELASIRRMMRGDAGLEAQLNGLLSVKVPGQEASMPSMTKLMFDGVDNYFGKNKAELFKRYRDIGAIKDVNLLYHEGLDTLAYMPGLKSEQLMARVKKVNETFSKWSGNTWSEEFVRFLSADAMRQLTDPLVRAGKMDVKTQNAYMLTFVNRVNGNYVSSQRPIIFQGTTGAAIGLFQTYAFNVLQQLFRHIENRNTKALLTMAGLQSTVYGMNGLPGFDFINQHLLGRLSTNPEHHDAYNVLPGVSREWGNWLLYGTASAFPFFHDKAPALYTRGDLNPRHMTVIPVHPLDVPAINASLKFLDNARNFTKKLNAGADFDAAFFEAIEHHGWNRPLAGMATLFNGYSTTGKGSLIAASAEMEGTAKMLNAFSRVIGARPMDEAIALNALYRHQAYQLYDRQRLDTLGRAVKTKLRDGAELSNEEIMDVVEKYTTRGGRIENFHQALRRWTRDANQSQLNTISRNLSNPYGRRLQELMGGEELEDFYN